MPGYWWWIVAVLWLVLAVALAVGVWYVSPRRDERFRRQSASPTETHD